MYDFCWVNMENYHVNNNPLYPKPTHMNSRIKLMNTQMCGPFAPRSRGYYNPELLMSSPNESFRLDISENIDPQIIMSFSSGSSSGDNFSSPSGSSRVNYRNAYDCSPLSLIEIGGDSSSVSAAKSPSAFVTPLTMEDDVLVMDEIFVVNALGGKSRSGKDTCVLSTSLVQRCKMDIGKDSSGSSASSVQSYKMDVGKNSSGSSASSVQSYKMDVCSSWAETGSCRFGSSCQLSHKKEEPSLARLSKKGKPELKICFPQNPVAYSSLSSFKGHNSRPAMTSVAVYGKSPLGSGTIGNYRGSPTDGSSSGDNRRSTVSKDTRSPITHFDWIPQDDGIDARQHGSALDNPSRYEVLECINNYLYAPHVKNRLPIFTSICPDDLSSSSSSPTIKF